MAAVRGDDAADIGGAGIGGGQHLGPDQPARPVVEGAAFHVGGDGRHHLRSGRGRGRDAPDRRVAALQHRQLAQLAPEGERVLAIELVDLAVGLEQVLELARAIGDRLGEVLEPQRGDGLALAAQALVLRAGPPAPAAGARRRTPRTGCPSPCTAPRRRSRRAGRAGGAVAVSSGTRQDLEGHLAQDRQRAPAARQAAAQVDAGDVLHDAAAGLEHLAAAVDRPDAQQMVARGAGADAPRARRCWWRTRRRWWPGRPRRR